MYYCDSVISDYLGPSALLKIELNFQKLNNLQYL